MSGGAFDYKQYNIREIHETIQRELERMGNPKPKQELWNNKEYRYKRLGRNKLSLSNDRAQYF
jgi:hypothetical protein